MVSHVDPDQSIDNSSSSYAKTTPCLFSMKLLLGLKVNILYIVKLLLIYNLIV